MYDTNLQVVYVSTDELQEYKNNSKLHPSSQVDQITYSIEEFGFNNPILAWHNDDGEAEIVAGHGRLMAARKLGIEELPVVFLDHLSDEARRAYLLVDNQLTMSSGFDFDVLQNELDVITSIDMTQFDFAVDTNETDNEYHLEDLSDKLTDTLGVFITCRDEADQQRTYEEMLEGGYECRLLTL